MSGPIHQCVRAAGGAKHKVKATATFCAAVHTQVMVILSGSGVVFHFVATSHTDSSCLLCFSIQGPEHSQTHSCGPQALFRVERK